MISSLLKYLEEYMNVRNSSSITDGDKYNSYQQETTLDGMEEIVGGELPMEHTSLRLMLKTASLAKVERYINFNKTFH